MLLPIVERELRVAARRTGTYWIRFVAAALAIATVLFILLGGFFSRQPQMAGHMMFCVLSGILLVLSALAGVCLSASCLCSEKQDGTLGLLFLTDLRGVDIVLGKLTAVAVVAVYAGLAVIPVLGLPLLIGGVTLAEFGRMILALGATLLLSLATGLVASTICWETRTAMFATLAVQLSLTAGSFLVIWLSWIVPLPVTRLIVLPTPVAAFVAALDPFYRTAPIQFWISVGSITGLALIGLMAASLMLPRQSGSERLGNPLRRGGWTRADSELLARNPFAWITGRDRFPGWASRLSLGLLLLIWLGFLGAPAFARSGVREPLLISALFMAYGLHILVKVMMAVQATRQLGDDRRRGALELIAVTPLSPESIIDGLFHAFRRQFRWINRALLGVNLILFLVFAIGRPFGMPKEAVFIFCLIFAGGCVLLATDVRALIWVGGWAALRGTPPSRAALGTIARVLGVPWIGAFLFFLAVSGTGLSEEAGIFWAGLWIAFGVGTAAVAANRPRRELTNHFRALVAGDEATVTQARLARYRAP